MKAIENLKSYFKKVSDRRFLAKFEDRQHFYRVGYDERVRWFEMVSDQERIDALNNHSINDCGTFDRLFPKYANLVAPYMYLNDEQFAFILQEGYMRALEGYISKCGTLSASKVLALLTAMVRRAGKDAPRPMSEESKRLPAMVYRYIVREGIHISVAKNIKQILASDEELSAMVDKAIDVHYHIMEVKNGMNENRDCVSSDFIAYLSDMKEKNIQMPYEAEIMMNGIQVKYFHLNGLHLSKEAIVTLLANDPCGVCGVSTSSILAHEPLSPMWKELEYVLKGNIELYHRYRSIEQTGKLLTDKSVA